MTYRIPDCTDLFKSLVQDARGRMLGAGTCDDAEGAPSPAALLLCVHVHIHSLYLMHPSGVVPFCVRTVVGLYHAGHPLKGCQQILHS